jgi:hypothetical protein
MGWSCSFLADLPPQLPERGARIDHAGLGLHGRAIKFAQSKHGHTWPPPRARVDTVQNRPESWLYEGVKLGKLPPLHELYPGSKAKRVSGLEIEQHIANAKKRLK